MSVMNEDEAEPWIACVTLPSSPCHSPPSRFRGKGLGRFSLNPKPSALQVFTSLITSGGITHAIVISMSLITFEVERLEVRRWGSGLGLNPKPVALQVFISRRTCGGIAQLQTRVNLLIEMIKEEEAEEALLLNELGVLPIPKRVRHTAYRRLHMQTLIVYRLGFNQNYYTFTLILIINIVLCGKLP